MELSQKEKDLHYHLVFIGGFKMTKQFTITKKIAKHGNQAIIVIPKVLQEQIKPSMLVKVVINILEDGE